MAFDQGLAQRLRECLGSSPDLVEKKMFGGLAFMNRGHMFIGISGTALMDRVGPDTYHEALARTHVREMDFTGRPLNGYVFVDRPGFESDTDLANWVGLCQKYVRNLPVK